eukprot:RCo039762
MRPGAFPTYPTPFLPFAAFTLPLFLWLYFYPLALDVTTTLLPPGRASLLSLSFSPSDFSEPACMGGGWLLRGGSNFLPLCVCVFAAGKTLKLLFCFSLFSLFWGDIVAAVELACLVSLFVFKKKK